MKYLTITGNQFIDACLSILITFWPSLLLGVKTVLLVAISGTIIGLVIGLIIGGLRAIKVEKGSIIYFIKWVYDILAKCYVEIFRGTPMMVQAVFIYYWLKPAFGWSPNIAGIFVISINTGAYMAEIIRAGIQSVEIGQTEAARSLGMSAQQTMMSIIIPQAIKNAFPAIGNEFIVNIKDSSVLNVISVTELFFQAKSIAGSLYRYEETFLVTAFVYLFLTIITSFILNLIEKRINKTKTSFPTSSTTTNMVKAQGEH
ncbi:MAG: amino acid ABC transporter permease [Erysipelotrichaceae bacterium]|nr:amino acid ABC transporter permease [Erysipelotrichaceae bacterium]MDD4641968.1 amino acid ABC transporter permease [Erysipelotrichaceae bacterium]